MTSSYTGLKKVHIEILILSPDGCNVVRQKIICCSSTVLKQQRRRQTIGQSGNGMKHESGKAVAQSIFGFSKRRRDLIVNTEYSTLDSNKCKLIANSPRKIVQVPGCGDGKQFDIKKVVALVVVKCIKVDKSPGPDQIYPRTLQKASEDIISSMVAIYESP